MLTNELTPIAYQAVNRAFSKQSASYDLNDQQNIVLQDMRLQVYEHVSKFLRPQNRILELNAGTGIDALHFVQQGYTVHATDLSDGMVEQIKNKIDKHAVQNQMTCQQISYDQLHKLDGMKFDYVFSNFGGLNCIDDLTKITKPLHTLLNPGAYVTWVIMPPVYLWELLLIVKGNVRQAFRRFNKNGIIAHVEGEYFKTYYHSLADIKRAFDSKFEFVAAEGLCTLSPPPSRNDFPVKHSKLYQSLRKLDSMVRAHYPFNCCADHIIVTFKLLSS